MNSHPFSGQFEFALFRSRGSCGGVHIGCGGAGEYVTEVGWPADGEGSSCRAVAGK